MIDLERHPRLASFLSSGLDPATTDRGVLRRVRILNAGTLAMCALGIPFVFRYLGLGAPRLAAALVATILVCAANLWLLRRTHNPGLAGHVATAAVFALLVISNLTSGGFYDPNFAWLYVVPLIASVAIDQRAAWIWIGVLLATTLVFWLLPSWGVVVPDLILPGEHALQSLFNRLSAILAVGLLYAWRKRVLRWA